MSGGVSVGEWVEHGGICAQRTRGSHLLGVLSGGDDSVGLSLPVRKLALVLNDDVASLRHEEQRCVWLG